MPAARDSRLRDIHNKLSYCECVLQTATKTRVVTLIRIPSISAREIQE